MANRIVITGRLVADPEMRQTANGIAVTGFRVAVPRRFSKEDKADFFDVEAWRGAAEFVSKYFAKGKLIEIDGALQTAPWTDKNGSKHQGVRIIAEQVSFVGDKPKEQSGEQPAQQQPPKSDSAPAAPASAMPDGFDPFAQVDGYGDLPF